MKEKVFINRVAVDYQALFSRAKEYLARHGVNISFEFVQSDYKNLSGKEQQDNFGRWRVYLQPLMANVVPIDPSYDFTSFVFNGREFPPPNIPTSRCYCPDKQPFIDILTDPLNPKDADYVAIVHEHMHAIVHKANQTGFNVPDVMDTYRENINPESPTGNFAEQWGLLQGYIKSLTKTQMYKYFSAKEVVGLKPELVRTLDNMRNEAGVAFKITSGFRTPEQNAQVGGKPNSAHLRGLAVDLLCTDNSVRNAMLRGVYSSTVPFFLEIAKSHLHIDIDNTIHALSQCMLSEDE